MDKERDQIRPKDIIHITVNCETTIQINKTTKHTEANGKRIPKRQSKMDNLRQQQQKNNNKEAIKNGQFKTTTNKKQQQRGNQQWTI
jgi:hypothetical protein